MISADFIYFLGPFANACFLLGAHLAHTWEKGAVPPPLLYALFPLSMISAIHSVAWAFVFSTTWA